MSDIVLALFAAAPPAATEGWSNKEVLIALGSTVAVLLPILWGIIEYIGRGYRSDISALKKENAELQTRLERVDEVENERDSARADARAAQANATTLSIQLKACQLELKDEEGRHTSMKNAADVAASKHADIVGAIESKLELTQRALEDKEGELDRVQTRIANALKKDGRTWGEKVMASTLVRFLPLGADSRQTPIISVLNLKGGVGKTTLTANLGKALDSRGYRVLMVDLDLQGSLSNIFLEPGELDIIDGQGRELRHLLCASFDADSPDIRQWIRGIRGNLSGSGIIPTSDELAYTEAELAARWWLRDGTRDVRFLLRKQLHLRRITNEYDVVLLDCPPFVSVSCVNALAASDYLLVPVMPSAQATDRVPVLLSRLREFITNINHELRVLGIVANRTYGMALTSDEENRMTGLLDQCNEVLGQHVNMFQTNIPQSREVRVAEDEHRPLQPGDDLHEVFLRLSREITSRLPAYCAPKKVVEGAIP